RSRPLPPVNAYDEQELIHVVAVKTSRYDLVIPKPRAGEYVVAHDVPVAVIEDGSRGFGVVLDQHGETVLVGEALRVDSSRGPGGDALDRGAERAVQACVARVVAGLVGVVADLVGARVDGLVVVVTVAGLDDVPGDGFARLHAGCGVTDSVAVAIGVV